MNPNVRFCLLFYLFNGLASGVWAFVILSAFLSELEGGSNAAVGLAEAIQGIANVATAIPAGQIADRCSRQQALFLAVVVGLVAVALSSIALTLNSDVLWLDDHRYEMICVSLGFFGAYQGMFSGPLNSIYADSVSTEDRPKYQVYLTMAQLTSSTGGPILAIVLFQIWGDNWGMRQLTSVYLVGMAMTIPPILLLLGPRDFRSLGTESDAVTEQGNNDPAGTTDASRAPGAGRKSSNDDVETADNSRRSDDSRTLTEHGELVTLAGEGAETKNKVRGCLCVRSTKHIPWVILASDIIIGLGSGMTIKFFPLFFKNEVELSPSSVNGVLVGGFLSVAVFAKAAQWLSIRFGRVQTALLCLNTGLLFLVAMAALDDWIYCRGLSSSGLVIPIFIARTALMNCSYPLRKSVMMDYIPKKKRGVWNGMDSITRFGWSGSAWLGGFLVDLKPAITCPAGSTGGTSDEQYGYTFFITAALQFLGASLLWFLIPLVPVSFDKQPSDTDAAHGDENSAVFGTSDSPSSTEEVIRGEKRAVGKTQGTHEGPARVVKQQAAPGQYALREPLLGDEAEGE